MPLMSSDKLTLISEILSKINKLLSKPVCAPELTKLSKLIQQNSQLEAEVNKAGRLAKRGLKKQQEEFLEFLSAAIIRDCYGQSKDIILLFFYPTGITFIL